MEKQPPWIDEDALPTAGICEIGMPRFSLSSGAPNVSSKPSAVWRNGNPCFRALWSIFLPGAGLRGEVPAEIHDHLCEMAASELSACPGESSWLISLLRGSISESSGRVPVFPSLLIYIAWEKQNVTGFAKSACLAGCMRLFKYIWENLFKFMDFWWSFALLSHFEGSETEP